jgi:class 3 adenylate cyclase
MIPSPFLTTSFLCLLVETIGDCYVAVTGLPNAQKHHAAILARFASECMTALSQVTREISDRLGKETLDMKMRIGLHSGSVTAGVLRGEKGRFQLFGDSVNTAARMEHTGVPDKIHCSEQFAEALRADEKGQWLTPREDKVFAKGLGELSTYWVVPSDVAKTVYSAYEANSMNSLDQAIEDKGATQDFSEVVDV